MAAILSVLTFLTTELHAQAKTFIRPPNTFEITTSSGYISYAWRWWQNVGRAGPSGSNPMEIYADGIDTSDHYTFTNVANWSFNATGPELRTWTIPKLSPGRYRISWANPSNFGGGGFGEALQEVAAWDPSSLKARISISARNIPHGESALVSWIAENADSAVISGPGLTSTDFAGSHSVRPPIGRHIYSITAIGFAGSKSTASVELEVKPNEILPTVIDVIPEAQITPKLQTVPTSESALLTLLDAKASSRRIIGTDGTNTFDPRSAFTVGPKPNGTYAFTYIVGGAGRIQWTVVESTMVILDPPSGAPIDVSSRFTYSATENGIWTIHFIAAGVSTDYSLPITVPTASDTATITFTSGPLPRTVAFDNATVMYGDSLTLSSSTNGDGAPTYSYVSGPGSVSGNSLSVSGVGVVRVRVDYPATAGYEAGTAVADVTVKPKPVTIGLSDQDFDFDGTPKVASYTVTDPNVVSAGMINADVTRGPAVDSYTVSVSAFGNYVGSASAKLRIFPVIDSFVGKPPAAPSASIVAPAVQWPAESRIQWSTTNASAVRISDESGAVLSTTLADSVSVGVLDARTPSYSFKVLATPLPAELSMKQRGGSSARLQGPDGLDLDVSGQTSASTLTGGLYAYTVSANGLSRSATLDLAMPTPASQVAQLNVTPATVTAAWNDRSLDGPYAVGSSDMPSWTIQTGVSVASLPRPLSWLRSDDGVSGSVSPGETIFPGSNVVTASFVPPNSNYSPATVSAKWSITAPITLYGENALLQVNRAPVSSGFVLRIIPGTTVSFSAAPLPNFDWGLDWSSEPTAVWTGSREILAAAAEPTFSVRVPAGTGPLSLKASAFQVGPRVVEFSPKTSSFTVPSGPAAGRTYSRSWSSSGAWYAYLGRDGVTLDVVGQARESGIAAFEIQAKPPGHEWMLLASGSPAREVANGPRASVPQTFSVKLGETNATKPLIPADPSLAGTWQIRARVQSTAGSWSAWSFEQPLNVVMPIELITKTGRTLPPVADVAWYKASPLKSYSFKVLVP